MEEVKHLLKENICQVLTDIYKEEHNGLLPNWDNEEEIIVKNTFTHINLMVLYSDEFVKIRDYVVTLDSNLFIIDERGNEIHWEEIDTTGLLDIYSNFYEQIN